LVPKGVAIVAKPPRKLLGNGEMTKVVTKQCVPLRCTFNPVDTPTQATSLAKGQEGHDI
jgi:hypothetical protein